MIPFPKPDITYESVFAAVVQQYFWEILRGTLHVIVEDDDREILLEGSTIVDEVMGWPHFSAEKKQLIQERLNFCRKADRLSLKNSKFYFCLKTPKAYGTPKISDLFESENAFNLAKNQFEKSELVAFECPVAIKNQSTAKTDEDSFLVYIQQTNSLARPDEIFIRDGLTIVGEKALKTSGVRALILAEEGKVSEFLGDSENPAHTKWLENTEHFKGKYSKGATILKYVKLSASRLVNALSFTEDEDLPNLLEDIFGLLDPNQEGKKKKPTRKSGKKRPPKPHPDPTPRPRYLSASKLQRESGFRVTNAPDAERHPDEITIYVAYDVEQGSPLKRYSPSDFNLAEDLITLKTNGCEIIERNYYTLRVKVTNPEFLISATGFDPKRDLFLKAVPKLNS